MMVKQTLDRWALAGLWLFAAVTCLSIAAQNILFVGMAAWATGLWLQRRWPRRLDASWLYAGFLLLALLASWYGENRAHSLFTWRKWLLAAAALYSGDALRRERELRAVLGSLLFFGGVVCFGGAIWALWQLLTALHGGDNWQHVQMVWLTDTIWRARAGSGGYQVLASNAAVLLAFFAGLASQDAAFRRRLPLLAMAGLAVGLLFTMTRGAWLAAALALGLLALLIRPRWLLGAALGLGLLWVAFPSSVFVQRLRSVGDTQNDSNRERIFMAEAAVNIIRQKPWLGVGDSLESFERPRADGSSEPQEGWYLRSLSPDARAWYQAKNISGKEQGHLHSVPLQLAVMYGLPALALFLLFWAATFGLQVRRWRASSASSLQRGVALGLGLGLIVWGFNGLFEYNFGSFQSSFTLWFLVGLGTAAASLPRGVGAQ